MKLIIDIPDEVLKSRHYCQYFGAWSTKLTETIENGIPYEERPQGDSISRKYLKEQIPELWSHDDAIDIWIKKFDVEDLIDNAPVINPCDNCDLYFKAMTKEKMKNGEEE